MTAYVKKFARNVAEHKEKFITGNGATWEPIRAKNLLKKDYTKLFNSLGSTHIFLVAHSDFVSYTDVLLLLLITRRWGHGGRPWSPRSRATPQGLDHRSQRDRESPKSERRKESVSTLLFSRTRDVLSHLNSLTHRFPQFSSFLNFQLDSTE